MRITITILGKQFTLELKLKNLLLKVPGLQVSTYFATMSDKGRFAAWKQKSSYYKRGFVLRMLWLGLIVRQGAVRAARGGILEEDTF